MYSGFTGSILHSQTWCKIGKTQAYSGFSGSILHSQNWCNIGKTHQNASVFWIFWVDSAFPNLIQNSQNASVFWVYGLILHSQTNQTQAYSGLFSYMWCTHGSMKKEKVVNNRSLMLADVNLGIGRSLTVGWCKESSFPGRVLIRAL